MAFIAILLPLTSLAAKPEINYNEQIVVTVQPNTKLKKAFNGLDLKKIKNLKIKDAPGASISLDFWDSYKVLKKMIVLETLDISDCKSLNAYIYADNHNAPLPVASLVLKYAPKSKSVDFPKSIVDAAIFFRDVYAPIYFEKNTVGDRSKYPNLKEVILIGSGSILNSINSGDDWLFANLDCGNSFIPSFNPKTKLIRYVKLNNLKRKYDILLGKSNGRDIWGGGAAIPITPENKHLEGVVVTDASFLRYLPKSISTLTIPKTLYCILANGNMDNHSVDTLIVEESDAFLPINRDGLYGIGDVKKAIFNRPIYFNQEPGISIFSHADKVVFNKDAFLDYANLGYGIKEIEFNGKTQIKSTLTTGANTITFNNDVSMMFDPNNTSREIMRDVHELIFKKTAQIDAGSIIGADKIFVPVGFNKDSHRIFRYAKEMDFNSMTVADPRLQPKDNIKIKPLKFNDPHIFDVEQAGTNRVLYFSTAPGKTLEDGLYYVPVSDNLYLSFSTENATFKGKTVQLSCGYLYEKPYDILETHIMVFSYIPVKHENDVEYGLTTGFYIVNPKYGEIVADFTNRATEISNRKAPYSPPKPKKKTYHERGRIEDCGWCLGTGMGWQGGLCPFCGGKGWYVEHEW